MKHHASHRRRPARGLAQALGWFSIGLGLAELLAPRAMGRATGLRRGRGLLQAYGVREIATGVALLAAKNPTPWLWARVAGDALDLGTLASRGRPRETTTLAALAAVAGVAMLDVAAARRSAQPARRAVRDYSGRSGLPRSVQEMRGAAREDFQPPADMVTPAPMRPRAVA
jgi:hypothetical protein